MHNSAVPEKMKTIRHMEGLLLLAFLSMKVFIPIKIGNVSESREGCNTCVDQDLDLPPKVRMEEYDPRIHGLSGGKSSTDVRLVDLWTALKSIGRYQSGRVFQKEHPLMHGVKLRSAFYLSVSIVLYCLLIYGLYNNDPQKGDDANDSPWKKEKHGYEFVFGFRSIYNNTVLVFPCTQQTVKTEGSRENCDEKRTTNLSSTPGTEKDTTCLDVNASRRDVSGSCGDVSGSCGDVSGSCGGACASCGGASASRHEACNQIPASSPDSSCFDGTTLRKVNHPEFVDQRAREESFRDWSRSKGPDPAKLADAGFYSIGSGGAVRCFCCGGGLSDLHPDSNPYLDHSRLYPRCEYISRHPNGNKHYEANVTSDTPTLDNVSKETDSNNNEPKSAPSPQERKSTLTLEEIKSLLEMGFKRSLIEDLICRQLSNEQNDVTTRSIIERMISDEPANITAKAEEKYKEKASLASNQQTKDPKRKKKRDKTSDTTNTPQTNGTLNSIKNNKDNGKIAAKLPADGDSVDHIKKENHELKEQLLCKICLDRTSSVVFLDCGHMVSCPVCAPSLKKCPICRKLVKGRIQVQ